MQLSYLQHVVYKELCTVGLVTYMKSAVCHITGVTVGFSKRSTLEF